MAERPDLGNVYGNLGAAIEATKGKSKAAISEVERLADEREKALREADAAEESQVSRETARGKKKQAVRKQTKAVVAEESAAIEAGDRAVVRETGAVDANTAAWRRNAAARKEAAAAGAEAQKVGRYPGAFAGASTPPLGYTYAGERAALDPSVYKPRKALAPHPSISEADQRALYEEQLGRKPGKPVPIGVQVEREGRQLLETSDPATYAKYASRAGWIKEAAKARKEEQKKALAEAKALDAEAAAEAVSAPKADIAKPVAFAERDLTQQAGVIRSLTKTQLKTLDEIQAGQTEFSARKRKTIEALKDAGLITAQSVPEIDVQRYQHEPTLAGYTGSYSGVRPVGAPVPTPVTSIESRALTPEQQYKLDAARTLEKRQALGTTVGDLSPAVRATKAPAQEEAAATKAAAKEEVAARKASQARMLEDQRAFDQASLAEAERYNAARQALSTTVGRQALGGAGGEGGGRGNYPPVALGGAGGAGGDGEGKIKATAASRGLSAAERDYEAIQQKLIAGYGSSSNALQRHGALTAEFIQGLVRGEVTLREFESQLVVTIGKFAGWAVAGGLVYGAYEGIKKLLAGVTETQSGVEQLKRSLGEKVNVPEAEQGFRKVAAEVNVPIGGGENSVATAQFYSARVFHDQAQALELASTALKAYKLDNVNAQDAVKSFGAISVAFALGPKEIARVFDQLDVGQLKFNARLNQTLPQVGRAAASYAAAGGTIKQLVDQIIQINRATGGGGGTGGGNPATALLREPANLTRPESEATLRRYKFNPKEARENIGRFNQEVQEGAAKGRFSEEDLQALAKAAGAGAGVGFRYLLPLFRIGRTSLPEEVRRETEGGKGSAEEDLKHKLAQLDEQFTKLGVDFEIFGSQLGGTGIEQTLGDVVGALNLVVKGAGVLISPFAALGAALSQIPAPLRQVLEVAAAVGAVRAVGRSDLGLSARTLASESGLFPTYAGGGAKELRSIQVGQAKALEAVSQAKENAFRSAYLYGVENVQPRRLALQRFEANKPANLSEEEEGVYQDQRKALKASLVNSEKQHIALSDRATALQAEAEGIETNINTLKLRKLSIEQRLLFAKERELAGVAAGGSPSNLPIIAPTTARAAEEKARLEAAGGGRGAAALDQQALFDAGVVGVASASPQQRLFDPAAQARAAAAVEGAAVTGGAEAAIAVSAFGKAGAAVGRLPGKLFGLAEGIGGFFSRLGIVGKGVSLLVGAEVLNQIDGANKSLAEGSARLVAVQHPSSEADLTKKLKTLNKTKYEDAKGPGGVLDFLGATVHDFAATFKHPEQAFESIFTSRSHPGTFLSDQRDAEVSLGQKQREALRRGLYKGLGKGEPSQAFHDQQQAESESAFAALEKATDDQGVEKALKEEKKKTKLRLDEFKTFGSGSKYGAEDIGVLADQLRGGITKFGETGDTATFEALIALQNEISSSLIGSTKAKVALIDKYGTGKESDYAFALAQSHLAQFKKEGYTKGIDETRKGLGTEERTVGVHEKELAKKPGDDNLKKAIESGKKKVEEIKNNLVRLGESQKEFEQEVGAAESELRKEHFQSQLSKPGGIRARGALQQARDGANRLRKAEDALVQLAQEEAAADAAFRNGLIDAKQRREEGEAFDLKRAEANEALVGAHVQRKESETAEHVSALSPKDKTGRAAEEQRGAEDTLKYYRSLKVGTGKGQLSKASKEEYERQARTGVNNARHAAQEAGESENKDAERKAKSEEAKSKREEANRRYQEGVTAHAELEESRTQDPLKRDRIKIAADRKLVKGTSGIERERKEAGLNNDLTKFGEDKVSEALSEIKFLEHVEKITTEGAIARIRGLLKSSKKLSKSVRQGLEAELFDLEHKEEGGDQGLGKISKPTLYDVRGLEKGGTFNDSAALGAVLRSRGGHDLPTVKGSREQPLSGPHGAIAHTAGLEHLKAPILHQTNYVNIEVHSNDPKGTTDAIHKVFRTNTRSLMRNARLAGV